LSLITVLVNPAHGIQGCFNTTSFDKNYWHFDFAINPFLLFFFSAASYPYIFRITPCRINAPLFSANHQPENPFPAFFFVTIFYSSLINIPIIYIEEIETTLLTLFSRVPGFMEGKG
jgi:hypothetical protein